jgi:putative tryptophan/tyrosine transport system substrate-binding protein
MRWRGLLGVCPAVLQLVWPAALRAQPSRPRRLGWLSSGGGRDDPQMRPIIDAVVGALCSKGWVLGQNYLIEFRFVQGDAARYPAMADEVVE